MDEAGGWVKSIAAWLPWMQKGFWAVLDQGLFSGANFLVNILLARWLEPEEYGAFAVALSIFYLLAGFHTAVLTEPMMVFGAGKYREQFRKYLGMLLYGHGGISLLIALGLGAAALVFARYGSEALAQALVGLALASPFLLLLWLVRRSCYAEMRPAWAVTASGFNLLLTLVGLFFVWRAGLLASFSALLLLGAVAGLCSLMLMVVFLRPRLVGLVGNPTPRMVMGDHWGYGRWVVLEGLAYSASAQLWLILVPMILGLAASGTLAAIWNLYRPVSLFMQALGLTLLPTFAHWVQKGISAGELRKRALMLATLFASVVGLYGAVLTIVAHPLLHFLYGSKYEQYWFIVPLFGVATVAAVLVQNFIIVMKAQKNVSRIPFIWSISALTILVISIPLMILWGISGAMIGYTLGYVFAAYVAYHMLRAITSATKTMEV